ncbi:MAG: hypothetical protein WCH39_04380 [Schlesneria sp.]
MHRWLAFAWIWGLTNAVAYAGEMAPSPLMNLKRPRIFEVRGSKFPLLNDSPKRQAPTFDAQIGMASDGNLVEFHGPILDNAFVDEEAADDTSDSQSGRILMTQYSEEFQEGQRENTFPSPPAVPTPLLNEAIPLDGAPRNSTAKPKVDEYKFQNQYSSLAWIAGANDRLGMIELLFNPPSRVWYDPTRPVTTTFVDIEWGARWLNGPDVTDLPPQLFNIGINVGDRFRFNDAILVDVMISPSWYTDFSNKGVQSFRMPWHLVTYYTIEEDWYWVAGVTDLARDDIKYLPVLGTVYAPKEGDVRLDLVFPRPKISRKLAQIQNAENGITFKGSSYWLTLSGELGGGSWAISRENRAYDVVTYRDYRLVAGLEQHRTNGQITRLEGGWILGRSVDYRSNIGNYNPSDTFMIRISSEY